MAGFFLYSLHAILGAEGYNSMIYVLTSRPSGKGCKAMLQRGKSLGIPIKVITGNTAMSPGDVVFVYEAKKPALNTIKNRTDITVVNGVRYNKQGQYKILAPGGVPVPNWALLKPGQKNRFDTVAFPAIMKPNVGGYARGVKLVPSADKAKSIRLKENMILQEYVDCKGECTRVLMVGDDPAIVVTRIAHDGYIAAYDFGRKGKLEFTPLTDKELEICIKACKLLKIEIGGVDIIRDSKTGEPYILEVNHFAVPFYLKEMYKDATDTILRYLHKLEKPRTTNIKRTKAVPTKTSIKPAKPRVLWIVDKPGWSHDNKTEAITRQLSDEFDFDKQYLYQSGNVYDYSKYSHVHISLWYWPVQHKDFPRPPADITTTTISSWQSWEKYGRAKTAAHVKHLYGGAVCVNRELFNEFSPIIPRTYHCPNGVDTEMFTPGPATSNPKFTVGFAGNPWMHKGRKKYFKLIKPALDSLKNVTLRTALGKYPYKDIKPHAEMPAFYQSLDAYVHAAGGKWDTAPNPVLEAAACGIPIIISPVGDWKELFVDGETALVLPTDPNPKDIVNAINRLAGDKKLQRKLAIGARFVAEKLSWSGLAEKYRKVFKAHNRPRGVIKPSKTRTGLSLKDRLGRRDAMKTTLPTLNSKIKKSPKAQVIKSKPRIGLLVDYKGWAWDINAHNIAKHLSQYYDFDIYYTSGGGGGRILFPGLDLVLCFRIDETQRRGGYVRRIPAHKRLASISSFTNKVAKRILSDNKEGAKFLRNSYAGVGAVSRELADFIKPYHRRVYYIPRGVETDHFLQAPRPNGKKLVVGWVGTRDRANKVYPAFELAKKHLGDKFIWSPRTESRGNPGSPKLTHEDMATYYSKLDVLVHTACHDGTPNPIFEAASSGVCIVSTPVGSAQEFMRDGVNCLKLENGGKRDIARSLVTALEKLDGNRELVDRFGRTASREMRDNWDWEKIIPLYKRMFDQSLTRRKGVR